MQPVPGQQGLWTVYVGGVLGRTTTDGNAVFDVTTSDGRFPASIHVESACDEGGKGCADEQGPSVSGSLKIGLLGFIVCFGLLLMLRQKHPSPVG